MVRGICNWRENYGVRVNSQLQIASCLSTRAPYMMLMVIPSFPKAEKEHSQGEDGCGFMMIAEDSVTSALSRISVQALYLHKRL